MVQCLVCVEYVNGGLFIMEMLLYYLIIENYFWLDLNIEFWFFLGIIVQIGKEVLFYIYILSFDS